jgi:uncharacterized membrane protein
MVELPIGIVDVLQGQTYFFLPHFHVLRDLIQAIVPLFLAIVIFKGKIKFRSFIWCLLFIIFIVFLPNAPYTLGDIGHFVGFYDSDADKKHAFFEYVPLYVLYSGICIESFTISLMLFGSFMKEKKKEKYIFLMESALILLSSFGIVIGRFEHLYSWYIIDHPEVILKAVIDAITTAETMLFFAIITVILSIFYFVIKWLNKTFLYWFKANNRLRQQ